MPIKVTGRVTSATPMKGRGTIRAVKRSVCQQCGGCYGKSPAPHVKECGCANGGKFIEIDLGLLSDSGPTKFFPRQVWKFQQWLAGKLATIRERAA